MSFLLPTFVPIVAMGLSIYYSLLMTRRFRDELAAGRSVRGAVVWTVATAGEAILFSGLIVMIGFMGLLLIGAQLMTSLGIGGAVWYGKARFTALLPLGFLTRITAYHRKPLRG